MAVSTPNVNGPPRRIALVCGVCTERDAISNVVRLQERILRDAGHDVVVFSHYTEVEDPDHVTVTDPWMLMREPRHADADLVVLHFGIQYGLFDSLQLSHDSPRVVHFHNVTPPRLLSGSARRQAELGLRQLVVAEAADVVWSDSSHNTECLLEWTDVPEDRIRPMPLAVPWIHNADAEKIGRRSGPTEVLYVGRFTPAKGVDDLVAAVGLLPEVVKRDLVVRLVGSSQHSDADHLAAIRESISGSGLPIRIETDLSDEDLRSRYARADVFVTASHHEGFCIPVIEALASGCRVVATDTGALPETVGRFGRIVPDADVEALSAALAETISELGDCVGARDVEDLSAYLGRFTEAAFRDRTLRAVDELFDGGARLPAR